MSQSMKMTDVVEQIRKEDETEILKECNFSHRRWNIWLRLTFCDHEAEIFRVKRQTCQSSTLRYHVESIRMSRRSEWCSFDLLSKNNEWIQHDKVDPEGPTSPWNPVYLRYRQRECKSNLKIAWDNKDISESLISADSIKKYWHERNYAFQCRNEDMHTVHV